MEKVISINATHIIFISDIHFGIKQNSEEWQENQKKYFYNFFLPEVKAIKRMIGPNERLICINLGDTFHDRQAIDINVNNMAIDIFTEIGKEVETYIMNGNHDLSRKTNQGNTSIRSLEGIPGVHIIKDPTLLNINYGSGTKSLILIPYLGSVEKENEMLIKYSGKTDCALMHTVITKMKMDNGSTITDGINQDIYSGFIMSGHIHRRQETKKVLYIGSPYHLTKSDIGDMKGLYFANVGKWEIKFIPNTISPIYQTIPFETFSKLNETEKTQLLENNYTGIIINEEDIPKIKKKFDIYNLGNGIAAKSVKPVINKQKLTIEIKEDIPEDQTFYDLIKSSILELDIQDDEKERLVGLSAAYLTQAEQEIAND